MASTQWTKAIGNTKNCGSRLVYFLKMRQQLKSHKNYLSLGTGKKVWGGGAEYLEMWLIKNTWLTPSLRHKNDWPRLEIAWPTPLVKTWMFGFLLIIVLCLTKFVGTLLQPISKSQKSHLSLKRQNNVKNRTFLVSMDIMSLDTTIPQNEGILKLSVTKHMKISTKATHSYTLLAGNA